MRNALTVFGTGIALALFLVGVAVSIAIDETRMEEGGGQYGSETVFTGTRESVPASSGTDDGSRGIVLPPAYAGEKLNFTVPKPYVHEIPGAVSAETYENRRDTVGRNTKEAVPSTWNGAISRQLLICPRCGTEKEAQ